MYVNSKKNQQFRTIDFLGLVVSCVAVIAIIAPIVNQSIGANENVKAQLEAEDLAQKLIKKDYKTLDVSEPHVREPASLMLSRTVSQMDPWGHPYHYKLARNEKGNPAYLIVWSAGPNGSSESDDVEVKISSHGPEVSFQGDDVGSVTPIR